MSKIEQELNNRFKHEELCDDSFETEVLWDSIADKLDPVESTTFAMFSKLNVGLLLLALSASIMLYYFLVDTPIAPSNNTDNANQTTVTEEQNLTTIQNIATTLAPSEMPEKAQVNPTNNQDNLLSKYQKQTINQGSSKKALIPAYTQKSISPTDPKLGIEKSSTSNKKIDQASGYLSDIGSKNYDKNNSFNKSSSSSSSVLGYNSSSLTLGIRSIPSLVGRLTLLEKAIATMPDYDSTFVKNTKMKTIAWSVGVISGMNALHLQHKHSQDSELTSLKNTTDNISFGSTFGVQAEVLIKDKWTVSSGLEYHNLSSEFDFESNTNGTVLKPHATIKIVLNSSSGDTINVVKVDTIVNAAFTRSIKHYNNYKRLSIPLEFGIKTQSGQWAYGFKAGALFNFTLAQSGKALGYPSSIIEFDRNNTSPLASVDVGVRLTPLIGYELSDKLNIKIEPQWMWSRNQKESATSFQTDMYQFNVNLGLSYGF